MKTRCGSSSSSSSLVRNAPKRVFVCLCLHEQLILSSLGPLHVSNQLLPSPSSVGKLDYGPVLSSAKVGDLRKGAAFSPASWGRPRLIGAAGRELQSPSVDGWGSGRDTCRKVPMNRGTLMLLISAQAAGNSRKRRSIAPPQRGDLSWKCSLSSAVLHV